jgi:hypothetical protein
VTLRHRAAERGLEQGMSLGPRSIPALEAAPAMSNMAVEKPGIFEIDQPEPVAVIQEIGGQEIIVAEDDRQRRLRRFKPV